MHSWKTLVPCYLLGVELYFYTWYMCLGVFVNVLKRLRKENWIYWLNLKWFSFDLVQLWIFLWKASFTTGLVLSFRSLTQFKSLLTVNVNFPLVWVTDDGTTITQVRTKVFFWFLHTLNEILWYIEILKQFKVGNHLLYF